MYNLGIISLARAPPPHAPNYYDCCASPLTFSLLVYSMLKLAESVRKTVDRIVECGEMHIRACQPVALSSLRSYILEHIEGVDERNVDYLMSYAMVEWLTVSHSPAYPYSTRYYVNFADGYIDFA